MTKIYIVKGWTGEYSDKHEWPVAAYEDEKTAVEHAHQAEVRAKELWVDYHANDGITWKNEYDLDMDMDYTGTHYYVEVVELFHDLVHYKLAK